MNPSDFTEDSIIGNSRERFVYLKKKESYTDKYLLIGFQLTGGNYTFSLEKEKLKDFVEATPEFDEEINKFIYPIIKLPQQVGKYKLYHGKFFTNQVKVSFQGIDLKD